MEDKQQYVLINLGEEAREIASDENMQSETSVENRVPRKCETLGVVTLYAKCPKNEHYKQREDDWLRKNNEDEDFLSLNKGRMSCRYFVLPEFLTLMCYKFERRVKCNKY